MFNSRVWQEAKDQAELSSPGLFSELKEVCLRGKESSTYKNYTLAFKHFSKWCETFNFEYLPASHITVALYLVHVVREAPSCSRSKLNMIFYAINWAHIVANAINPCSNDWLKLCLQGCIRMNSKPINKKEPITVDILKVYVDKYASEDSSLGELRNCCIFVLSFAGFFRISECLNLKRSNISICDSHCEIYVEKSKTDVLRDGNTVVIARTGNSSCPVSLLERYLRLGNIQPNSNEFIFRQIYLDKISRLHSLKNINKPISYSCLRDVLKRNFTSLGFDSSKFGLHSFRSGGASTSANNNVPERLLQRHGRWKSVSAKDGYIKDSLQDRLLVSKQLNL